MATDVSASVGFDWPRNVVEYAAKKGVEESLPKVMEMTRRLFPSARRFDVCLEEDPEIANLRFIMFQVEVAGLGIDQAANAQMQWCRELQLCMAPPYNDPFVLGLELVQ